MTKNQFSLGHMVGQQGIWWWFSPRLSADKPHSLFSSSSRTSVSMLSERLKQLLNFSNGWSSPIKRLGKLWLSKNFLHLGGLSICTIHSRHFSNRLQKGLQILHKLREQGVVEPTLLLLRHVCHSKGNCSNAETNRSMGGAQRQWSGYPYGSLTWQ